MIAAGYLFYFDFFHQTQVLVLFFMYWPFTLAMLVLGILIAVASPDMKSANSSGYAFVLLAIVIQSFLNNQSILGFMYA